MLTTPKLLPATLLLGPFLLAQGRYVRRTVVKLPEPEGARRGGTDDAGLRILVVGDSSAAGVGAVTQESALLGCIVRRLERERSVAWDLIAETGATTPQTIERLSQVEPRPFDVAVSALGINDLTAGTSVRKWIKSQQELVELLRKRFRVSFCILSGLPPIGLFPALPQPLRWYLGAGRDVMDQAFQDWIATQNDCEHVSLLGNVDPEEMASDGFHPGPPIYAKWGEDVAERILKQPLNSKPHDTLSV